MTKYLEKIKSLIDSEPQCGECSFCGFNGSSVCWLKLKDLLRENGIKDPDRFDATKCQTRFNYYNCTAAYKALYEVLAKKTRRKIKI